MEKKDLEIKFAVISTEFKIIKKLIYIIIAALIGLLLNAYWSSISKAPTIVGNVIKNIFQ